MKKVLTVLLITVLLTMLALPSAAGFSDSMNASRVSVRQTATPPTLDGVIGENEYKFGLLYYYMADASLNPTSDGNGWYITNDAATGKDVLTNGNLYFYLLWDATNLYFAAEIDVPGWVQNQENPGLLWQDYCIQLQFATQKKAGDTTTKVNDYGFAINESDEAMQFDFTNNKISEFQTSISRENDKVIYEVIFPWADLGYSEMDVGSNFYFTCGANFGDDGVAWTTMSFGNSETESSYHTKLATGTKTFVLVDANGEGAPVETEPPVTEPPVTEPPATEPPVTDPPATDPPATDAPTEAPTDVPTEAPTDVPTEAPSDATGTKAPSEPSDNGGLWWIIAAVAGVVVVAVVLFLIFKKKK